MGKTEAPLFDANVLIDVATLDPKWYAWSKFQFERATALGGIAINPIIYAELAPSFTDEALLVEWLEPSVFKFLALPYEAGWLASQAFLKYRRAGGAKLWPLPDFFIGAHAEVAGLTIVTRDEARYRTYFPNVPLVSP